MKLLLDGQRTDEEWNQKKEATGSLLLLSFFGLQSCRVNSTAALPW